jgi:hypothetical protein
MGGFYPFIIIRAKTSFNTNIERDMTTEKGFKIVFRRGGRRRD